jgi:hypothetical protein
MIIERLKKIRKIKSNRNIIELMDCCSRGSISFHPDDEIESYHLDDTPYNKHYQKFLIKKLNTLIPQAQQHNESLLYELLYAFDEDKTGVSAKPQGWKE